MSGKEKEWNKENKRENEIWNKKKSSLNLESCRLIMGLVVILGAMLSDSSKNISKTNIIK